jgi:hypothetical protein
VARLPRTPLGRRLVAVRAWLRRRALDERLAEGADAWSSPDLFMRARALASAGHRQRVAESLIGLVRLAERRGPVAPQLVLRDRAILAHRATLLALAARLCAEAPVDVAVVAQLTRLVDDDASPAYGGGRPERELAPIVARCARAVGDLPMSP